MTATLPARHVPVAKIANPHPRQWRPAPWLAGIGGFTVALWLLGGGAAGLSTAAGRWLAAGQLAGLAAALSALLGLVLVARPGWLEKRAGLDRLWAWHRLAGITVVVALAVHLVASLMGFAQGRPSQAWDALWTLLSSASWMVAAVVAAALFVTVGLTSWRRVRGRLTYETWYAIHVCGYLAVVLGFGHQLTVGSDLTGDSPAHRAMRLWWIGLALATVAVILWSRVGGLLTSMSRGRATVVAVTRPARNTVALELSAPRLAGQAVAGQFFLLRFRTRDLWWQAHPVSMSARPVGDRMRFTIRVVGDGSARMAALRPGVRVLLEGPYGRFTAARAQGRPVVLIGGGVGIAPLRALLEDCTAAQRPVVVARVPDRPAMPHDQEIRQLVAAREGTLTVVEGPRSRWHAGRPFSGAILRQAIADIAGRDVFVCGPPGMERAVLRGLREAGVDPARIHVERFGV